MMLCAEYRVLYLSPLDHRHRTEERTDTGGLVSRSVGAVAEQARARSSIYHGSFPRTSLPQPQPPARPREQSALPSVTLLYRSGSVDVKL